MDYKEIANRFGFHKATIEGPEATLPKHVMLCRAFLAFAGDLSTVLPEGHYKSLTMDALEEASMWSHKAIAETAPLEELPEGVEVHDEETLKKVYEGLRTSGLATDEAEKAVREMQNRGILFREIKRKD